MMNQSMDKRCVLVVDDCSDVIFLTTENLSDHYAVIAATSGEKAIEMAMQAPKPDVVLMDVQLPGIDGYEACSRLKKNPETKDIDVIFVSSHDEVDAKLAGYEAGGCDYIVKPYMPEELEKKLQLAIENQDIRNSLRESSNSATKAAWSALHSAGDMGIILNFFRRCMGARSEEALGKLIIEAVTEWDLISTVQLRSCFGLIHVGTEASVPPLEQELLFMTHDKDSMSELGFRSLMSSENISLLIKNMPEDEEKRGRIRDDIMILLQGANECLANIELRKKNSSKEKLLRQLLSFTEVVFNEIQENQTTHKAKVVKIIDTLMLDIESAFHSLALHEAQEKHLVNLVSNAVEDALDNFEQGQAIKNRVQSIVERLRQYQNI